MKFHKLLATCLVAILAVFLIASPVMATGELIKNPANPVLWPTDAWEGQVVGAPSVILDAGVYKMWYTGMDNSGFPSINYAESVDGISWSKDISNPVLTNGGPFTFDSDGVGGACVIFDGGLYKMWYTGLDGLMPSIGYAWSTDGIVWTKQGTVAVLEAGPGLTDWDHDGVAFPSVINDGGVYKMWYTGRFDNSTGIVGLLAIGYASSTDGVIWVKDASNPVLERDTLSWDNRGVGACDVKKTPTGFLMFYTGFVSGGGVISRLGMITSADEITWTNAASPALDVGGSGDWDDFGVAAPTFLMTGSKIMLWYTGANIPVEGSFLMQIGEAETNDPAGVPAGSNLSTGLLIAGFVVLIGGVSIWSVRRNKA